MCVVSVCVCVCAEVVKVASLQPLHRMVYSGPVTAADHDATLALINHLMDSLTDQVSSQWRERERERERALLCAI